MRKHLSVLMLDLGEKFNIFMVSCAIIIGIKAKFFTIAAVKASSYNDILNNIFSSWQIWAVFCIIQVIILIKDHIKKKRSKAGELDDEIIYSETHSEYFIERLLISERGVYLWRLTGNLLRLISLVCLNIILEYVIHEVFMPMLPSAGGETSVYVGLGQIEWSGTLGIIAIMFFCSAIMTWADSRSAGTGSLILLILAVIIALAGMGLVGETDPMTSVLFMTGGILVVSYVMYKSHTGKRPARREEEIEQ